MLIPELLSTEQSAARKPFGISRGLPRLLSTEQFLFLGGLMNEISTQDVVKEVLDLGLWMGRSQAFGMLASKCSAAHAQCLKKLKDEEKHKALGMTWAQLCEEHLGLSRASADRIVLQLERYGDTYFNLSQVMEISPA